MSDKHEVRFHWAVSRVSAESEKSVEEFIGNLDTIWVLEVGQRPAIGRLGPGRKDPVQKNTGKRLVAVEDRSSGFEPKKGSRRIKP
jgi:hypothetical protein